MFAMCLCVLLADVCIVSVLKVVIVTRDFVITMEVVLVFPMLSVEEKELQKKEEGEDKIKR